MTGDHFGKGLCLVDIAEHVGFFKDLLRNFNRPIHQTFLYMQVFPAPLCVVLDLNIFVLGVQCALLSACIFGRRALIYILPGVLKRTRIQITLIHVHMTVSASWNYNDKHWV